MSITSDTARAVPDTTGRWCGFCVHGIVFVPTPEGLYRIEDCPGCAPMDPPVAEDEAAHPDPLDATSPDEG